MSELWWPPRPRFFRWTAAYREALLYKWVRCHLSLSPVPTCIWCRGLSLFVESQPTTGWRWSFIHRKMKTQSRMSSQSGEFIESLIWDGKNSDMMPVRAEIELRNRLQLQGIKRIVPWMDCDGLLVDTREAAFVFV